VSGFDPALNECWREKAMKVRCCEVVAPRRLELVERDLGALRDDEVLVRTAQASICDADLRAYRGMEIPPDMPLEVFRYLGHEGGGVVEAIGPKVREFQPGDRVMLFGPCSSFADHFKASVRHLHPVPKGLDERIAYLGEPTAVGVFGVFESPVQPGDTVVVTGLNYQGLIAVQGLKKKGAGRLIAVDYADRHLEMAEARGADLLVNTEREDALEVIRAATGGAGADLCFHSCGYWNPYAEAYFNLSAHCVRDEGVIVSLPDIMSPIRADLHRIHHHALDIRFPALMHHSPEFLRIWVPRVMRPLVNGALSVDDLITGSFPLEQAPEAMRRFDEDPDQVKILLTP
jgi:L-iditol 2-dehydrogenase